MYNVKEAFETLCNVLDNNITSEQKDFWQIYFCWWRFFYCVNENLEKASLHKDKVSLIEQFVEYSKELSKIEAVILERNKVAKDKLPSAEDIPFAPHIKNMQGLLKKEQERLGQLMKAVKKEKSHSRVSLVKRHKSKRSWLKS